MSNPTQFLRLYGYPRGQRSAANTVGSILAEGLREETHISHLSMKTLKIKCLLLLDHYIHTLIRVRILNRSLL